MENAEIGKKTTMTDSMGNESSLIVPMTNWAAEIIEVQTLSHDLIDDYVPAISITLSVTLGDGETAIVKEMPTSQLHKVREWLDPLFDGRGARAEISPDTDATYRDIASAIRGSNTEGATTKHHFKRTGWKELEDGTWGYLIPVGAQTATGINTAYRSRLSAAAYRKIKLADLTKYLSLIHI